MYKNWFEKVTELEYLRQDFNACLSAESMMHKPFFSSIDNKHKLILVCVF